jgi:outer membrane protein assembly factor BamD
MVKGLMLMVGVWLLLGGCAAQERQLLPDARAQYDYAMSRYEDGKHDDAVLEFQKVLFNYPGVSFIDSVQYWFAMSYFGREDYHLAAAEYRRLATNFSSSALADDAQLMIGKAYLEASPGNIGLDQSDTRDAIKELEAFLEDFPFSDRRAEGETLLLQAKEKLVTKQFKAAQQYLKLNGLLAARIYLEEIVTEHQYSAVVPEALFLLAEIDTKEAKYQAAFDKLGNLLRTYPEHKRAPQAEKMRQELESKLAEKSGESAAATTDESDE